MELVQRVGSVEDSRTSPRGRAAAFSEHIRDGTALTQAAIDFPGMTIAVVPYRRLMNEVLGDAITRGIDAVEWTRDSQNPAETVIVSADKLYDSFFDYIARPRKDNYENILGRMPLAITAHSWRPNNCHARVFQARWCDE
ncbi:hypothetical protein E4U59_001887 [Claviceps monticola]|nr:hypothetical protein E4U59_001887 [Claviceps monticola]